MYSFFTESELYEISSRVKIKNLSRIKRKKTFVRKLTEHFSCVKIQRWYRKAKAFNSLCPISMEYVRYPCWRYPTQLERYTYYNLPVLVDCLLTSGDFRDPISREKITYEHTLEIADIVRKTNIDRPDISEVFKSKIRFQVERELDEQIDILEDNIRTVTDSIIEDLLTVNESNTNIDEIFSPNLYDIKIASGILTNLSNEVHTRVIRWCVNKLKSVELENKFAAYVREYIVEIMEEELTFIDM